MQHLIKGAFLLVITVALFGCGPNKVAIKPEVTSDIRTIAIIRVGEPAYRMVNLGSPAAAMGAVGGAVIGADAEKNIKSLQGVVAKAKFNYGDQLTQDLQQQLHSAGFRTVIIDVERDKPDELIKDYSFVQASGADAILDVAVPNAGWVTEHFMFSPHWRPESRAFIALYSVKHKKVAYSDTLMYGYHNPMMSATDLDAPGEYCFGKREELMSADDAVMIEGLKHSSRSIAQYVASQLRP